MSATPRCTSLLRPQGRPHSSCTYTALWRVLSAGARDLGPTKGSKRGRAARPGLQAPALFQWVGREWLLAHFLGQSFCHPTSQPRVQSCVAPQSSSSPEAQGNISIPSKARIFQERSFLGTHVFETGEMGRDGRGQDGTHSKSLFVPCSNCLNGTPEQMEPVRSGFHLGNWGNSTVKDYAQESENLSPGWRWVLGGGRIPSVTP